MRTIETNIYQYAELSDAAKEKARDWCRNTIQDDVFYTESVYDDAAAVADLMGLDICQTRFTRCDGSHGYKPTIHYSGFWSQGDGACFEGRYRYKPGAVKALADYAPQDLELQRIARELQKAQKRYFYRLTASTTCARGNITRVNVEGLDVNHVSYNVAHDTEGAVEEALTDFAHWIYRRLEREYKHSISDDVVVENIEANEYEFTVDGACA